jgi:hypothetical protein
VHVAGDAANSLRDPRVYQAGLDYYHKDYSSGRNRWGDYSKAQVDPSDDASLWVLQQYSATRVGTNDGAGNNSSRWATWWANVAGPKPSVTLDAGPSAAEGDSGSTPVAFTIRLSSAYSVPVTFEYQTVDGDAFAEEDYTPAHDYVTIPAGATSTTVFVDVIGDEVDELDETFQLELVAAMNGTLGEPHVVVATIVDDDATVAVPGAGAPAEMAVALEPNPTRGSVNVTYAVPRAARVRIDVVDLQGRRVATLVDAPREPGRYVLQWDGRARGARATAGVYFVRCRADGRTIARRILVAP